SNRRRFALRLTSMIKPSGVSTRRLLTAHVVCGVARPPRHIELDHEISICSAPIGPSLSRKRLHFRPHPGRAVVLRVHMPCPLDRGRRFGLAARPPPRRGPPGVPARPTRSPPASHGRARHAAELWFVQQLHDVRAERRAYLRQRLDRRVRLAALDLLPEP